MNRIIKQYTLDYRDTRLLLLGDVVRGGGGGGAGTDDRGGNGGAGGDGYAYIELICQD